MSYSFLTHLERQAQDDDHSWDVGEDSLVEAGGEIRIVGVPSEVKIPECT